MKIIVLQVCVLLLLSVISTGGLRVKSSALLFRHGERTPLAPVGTLVNSIAADIGYKQLTRNGTRQMYELGEYLRSRYSHLVPTDGFFRKRNMQILSSRSDRCVMSLQSFMAGFMPPPVTDFTLPVMWQPFAMAVDNDAEVIYDPPKKCPKYDALIAELRRNPPRDIQDWLEKDAGALKELSRKIGVPMDNLVIVEEIAGVIRTNIAMKYAGTPQWAIDAYYSTLEKYIVRYSAMMYETEVMLQILGGPVIMQIMRNLEAVAANNSDIGRTFQIYSVHDFTILRLARILNVSQQIPVLPNYGDTIMVELVDNEDGNDKLQVQTVYVDNYGSQPNLYVLDVPGCGVKCSLDSFRNVVKNYLVNRSDLC